MTDMDKLFQRLQGYNLSTDSPQKLAIAVSALGNSVAAIESEKLDMQTQNDNI